MSYNEPLLSVILPVYNAEKYLKQSIESILKQTYKNFEFIIINDGSNDNSMRIINKYANEDNRIRIIDRDNRGLVYSLNEGISISKGKYIARMDADDISMPERFEKQLHFFNQNNDYGVVSSFINVFGHGYSENENMEYEFMHNKENIELIDILCCKHYICHPTVMIKKYIFDKYGGYREDYRYSEDLELWSRLLRNGIKFKNLPDKLLKYRRDKGSKTYSQKDLVGLDIIRFRIESIVEINKMNSKKVRYLIWGAGGAGKLCKQQLDLNLTQGKCVGYVDSYKSGYYEGIKIYRENQIKELDYDYVFIATTPGKHFATIYLNNIGKRIINDYINLID